jgi:CBS domain containing-hemolysin-like protein
MGTVDVILVVLMLLLLVGSGFFSAVETILFGLSQTDRVAIGTRSQMTGRVVESLLEDPRGLLITVLLGNMSVNTAYFVLGSALSMRFSQNVLLAGLIGLATVLCIVIFGEVIPKVVATSLRVRLAVLMVPPFFAIHRAITPLRAFLKYAVVSPLSRLTAPAATPPELNPEELDALVELSDREGVINSNEFKILREVLRIRDLRVSDVMVPRVDMLGVAVGCSRADVLNLVSVTRPSHIAVRGDDGDSIIGLLSVRDFLLDPRGDHAPIRGHLEPPRFVPELASIEALLDHFRNSGTSTAIAVNEFGGVAGLVELEDLVEELVGDIQVVGETDSPRPERISKGVWRVAGGMELDDWSEHFGGELPDVKVRTVGGLFLDQFGRMPSEGDVIRLGDVFCEVEHINQNRIISVVVRLESDQLDHESEDA